MLQSHGYEYQARHSHERCNSRKGSRPLVSTLVDVSSGSVISSQHGYDSVTVTVRSGDITTLGSNVVDVKTDSTGGLGDHRTGLQGIVDSLYRVVFHGDQEAGR
jgi:hypothetical protein